MVCMELLEPDFEPFDYGLDILERLLEAVDRWVASDCRYAPVPEIIFFADEAQEVALPCLRNILDRLMPPNEPLGRLDSPILWVELVIGREYVAEQVYLKLHNGERYEFT